MFCADAYGWKYTWLVEFVFTKTTIQAREDITGAGKIANPDPRKRYVRFSCFLFIYISGLMYSFGLALCGTRIRCCDSVYCNGAIRNIHVRKIRLPEDFVTCWICKMFAPEAVRRGRMDPSQAKSLCWRTQWNVHTWLVELVSNAILYRHEKILLRQGRLHAQTQDIYIYALVGFSLISLDSCIRLGSRFVWY